MPDNFKENQVQYWLSESLENIDTARVLMLNKKLLEGAFFCHLALEKILKAFFAKRNDAIPPKTHNLLLLADRSGLIKELGEDKLDFLASMNVYQLEGRYPGDREIIYKKTPVSKFNEILEQTEEEIRWLEQKLKSES